MGEGGRGGWGEGGGSGRGERGKLVIETLSVFTPRNLGKSRTASKVAYEMHSSIFSHSHLILPNYRISRLEIGVLVKEITLRL